VSIPFVENNDPAETKTAGLTVPAVTMQLFKVTTVLAPFCQIDDCETDVPPAPPAKVPEFTVKLTVPVQYTAELPLLLEKLADTFPITVERFPFTTAKPADALRPVELP
jgi:hypothetical protein